MKELEHIITRGYKFMLYRKITQSTFLLLLVGVLFTVSFTTQAAPIVPLEEVHPIATANPVNDSAEEVVAIAEKAIEAGKEKVEEEKEREAAQKAEFERQKKLLAALIFCEAGNQPYTGQVAVGAVVMNRIASSKYPNDIDSVIYQRGQFGPAGTGKLDRVLRSGSYTAASLQAAEDALNGVDPVEGCLYFGCGSKGIKIGAHYFH